MKLNERTYMERKPQGARRAAEVVRRVEVPFMGGAVMAGFPSPAEQYVERPPDLNELLVTRPAATYFVRASGDSMEGVGIRSGDMLVVDRSLEPWDRAVVIACVDGEFTVKTRAHRPRRPPLTVNPGAPVTARAGIRRGKPDRSSRVPAGRSRRRRRCR